MIEYVVPVSGMIYVLRPVDLSALKTSDGWPLKVTFLTLVTHVYGFDVSKSVQKISFFVAFLFRAYYETSYSPKVTELDPPWK